MQRWMLPVALSALVAGVLAWLFATETGALVRRQITKHGQIVLEQGGQTLDQVRKHGELLLVQGGQAIDQVGHQVQEGAQDLRNHGRRLVDTVTR